MPRSFSEKERTVIREEMLKVGNSLMRIKNIRQITVEEITKTVNISKGSFYSFYSSREELFWDIIKTEERMLLSEIEEIAQENISKPERLRKIFFDAYLRKNWLVYSMEDSDLQYLVRKLPTEIIDRDTIQSYVKTEKLFKLFDMEASQENMEFMRACIDMILLTETTSMKHNDSIKLRMQNILVDAIINYICKED